MNKKFNPGDSVVICTNSGQYCGIVNINQLYNRDIHTAIVDVEVNGTESETCRIHKKYVHHACQQCYGKGMKYLGGFEIECDKCNGEGYND